MKKVEQHLFRQILLIKVTSLGSKNPDHALIFFGNLTGITAEKFCDYLEQ